MPSGRTITLLFAALTVVVGLYAIALKSSLFALEKVEIRGATPALSRQIDTVVGPLRGRSLVGLNGAGVEQAILAIPEVQTVRVDRAFPNTLRVVVSREHPVAVLRRGREAWVIAASGKVRAPAPARSRTRSGSRLGARFGGGEYRRSDSPIAASELRSACSPRSSVRSTR